VGFALTFYYLSAILAIAFILLFFTVPNTINKTKVPKKLFKGAKNISFIHFIKNRRVLMASISTTMSIIFIAFYLSIYSEYLLQIKVDKEYIGFIFGIAAASGFVSAPFVGILMKRTPKIYIV
jgi:predicted MFS family arabinose efflux permease